MPMDFVSKEDAKIWIINNQLARRNISLYDKGKLVLQKKDIMAKQAKDQQGTRTDLLMNSSKSFEPFNNG
jgi:hypothetical protein